MPLSIFSFLNLHSPTTAHLSISEMATTSISAKATFPVGGDHISALQIYDQSQYRPMVKALRLLSGRSVPGVKIAKDPQRHTVHIGIHCLDITQ